jgi:hypothetical protein
MQMPSSSFWWPIKLLIVPACGRAKTFAVGNRQLTPEELRDAANPLLASIRESLTKLSGGDTELLFALRRKIAKELMYDERGKPLARVKLKLQQRLKQGGLCKVCSEPLPERGAVLDRLNAMDG